MLKAIVLDFDGVIIDTESEWYDIYRDWLKSDYNYDLQWKIIRSVWELITDHVRIPEKGYRGICGYLWL